MSVVGFIIGTDIYCTPAYIDDNNGFMYVISQYDISKTISPNINMIEIWQICYQFHLQNAMLTKQDCMVAQVVMLLYSY